MSRKDFVIKTRACCALTTSPQGRKARARLLEEMVQLTEYNRHYAAWVLRNYGKSRLVSALRAHLGLPILGDPLYGTPPPPGAPARMCLHAAAVELMHPASGKTMRIDSPLPTDFQVCYGGPNEATE